MKTILNILACILIYGSGAATGFVAARIYRNHCLRIQNKVVSKPLSVQTIPSAIEIQQKLKIIGKPRYDPGKIDGKVGRKTQTAWDNYICDQYAIRAIEGR